MTSKDKKVISSILKKEDLVNNLNTYAKSMINLEYEYSSIRLSLNYFTMKEIMEDKSVDPFILDSIKRISDIISKNLNGVIEKNIVDDIKEIDSMRANIIKKMKVLTAYTDTLQIYEHIINRVEYLITKEMKSVDINALSDEVYNYVFDENDSVVINSKIQLILGQLPVRMTKNRFYDILGASLAMYNGSDVAAVNDFVSTIRTSAMLEIPEGYESEYPKIYTFIEKLKNTEYMNLDIDAYKNIVSELEYTAEYINSIVTNYIQMVEIINDLYILVMLTPYEKELQEGADIAKEIIIGINDSIKNETSIPSSIDELLYKLEGLQEPLYEDILMYEGILFDIKMESFDIIKDNGLEKTFESLYMTEKLLSSSLFVDLKENEEEHQIADNSYILCARDELVAEFSEMFKKNNKMLNRSVMAFVISCLPVFFNNQEEIKEYIDYTLKHCNNDSELMAVSILLRDIIRE